MASVIFAVLVVSFWACTINAAPHSAGGDQAGNLCGHLPDQNQNASSDPGITGCGNLAAPKNGKLNLTISSDANGQWEVATFACNMGYNLIGPSSIACSNGSWVGKEPICKPVSCGKPESILNGEVHYESTTFESRAVYTCDSCYELFGVAERSCKKSSRWSKTKPFCVPQECVLPELGEGLYVKGLRADSGKLLICGAEISVGCYLGYRQSGAAKGTCLPGNSIVWEGRTPTCTKL